MRCVGADDHFGFAALFDQQQPPRPLYRYLYLCITIYIYILHSADVCASSSLPYLCVRNADVFNVFSTRSQGVEQWGQKLTAYIHRDMEAFPLHYLQPQIAFSAMPWRLTMPMPVARQAPATWYMGICHMYPWHDTTLGLPNFA